MSRMGWIEREFILRYRVAKVLVVLLSVWVGSSEAQLGENEVRARLASAAQAARMQLEFAQTKVAIVRDLRYSTMEFLWSLQSTKAKLEEPLLNEDLAPFHSYVDRRFPSSNAVLAKLEEDDKQFIRISVAYDFYRQADGVISAIGRFGDYGQASLAPLSLNLEVITVPDGAEVTVHPTVGGRPNQTTSNSVFKNLYRGYYDYVIRRDGFKEIKASLNLIDDPRSILECTLQATGTATPCKRR